MCDIASPGSARSVKVKRGVSSQVGGLVLYGELLCFVALKVKVIF